ncbi:hypothetical protein CAEBREN_21117 [Caenorhabditis brenneri]|uniref:Nuclear receptor domain-containing protein n=1 Tax=Caenorhabditis brenneri TaxID=135651 RepID=G0N059_CAEBE|nr:hypothetical protein CAEBREN_21117 [Caenorhabditis brenneri]
MASLDDWRTEPWEITADESESKRKRLCMICIRKEKTSKIGGCDACCKKCRIFFKRMLKLSSPLAPCAEQNHPVLLCVHCHQQKCMELGMGEIVRQDPTTARDTV